MGSPAVHHAQSLEDALTMLDSHVPLTFRERKLIVESLYDLAFREGARQGRQAGMEAVYAEIRTKAHSLRTDRIGGNTIALVLESLLPPSYRGEYVEPTQAIRRTLEDKQRAAAELSKHTRPFDFERGKAKG